MVVFLLSFSLMALMVLYMREVAEVAVWRMFRNEPLFDNPTGTLYNPNQGLETNFLV